MSWWPDLQLAIESSAGGESAVLGTAGASSATVPNVPGLGGLLTTINAIWANLRDYKMWRSLGWLLLGLVLMLLGASWWLGPKAAGALPPVIP